MLLGALPASAVAAPLSLEEAIRSAWKTNLGIASSGSMVTAARTDAQVARDNGLPSLILSAKGILTNEPVAAFGLKLDEQRITAADFAPARLSSPDVVGGVGVGATIVQPIYMGGRLSAGARAAATQADAEARQHDRRRQELAFQVAQAYFGAQVAAEGVRYADDLLAQARATETFTKARNQQGLALDADVARATAFRAQAEADTVSAGERLASTRALLVLLAGRVALAADLTTPVQTEAHPSARVPAPSSAALGQRPDLESARMRAEAAREMVKVARASSRPEIMAQASVETLRPALDQGATWFTVGVFARWKLCLSDWRAAQAAESRASAASEAQAWQEEQAHHEVEEARRSLQTSEAKLISAQEAVSASESARGLRIQRHRQGLLQLTDVLDAEAALAGARALLLRTQYDVRIAAAELQLALGQPIEGVN